MSDKSELKAELERKKQRLAQIREEKKRKEEEKKKSQVGVLEENWCEKPLMEVAISLDSGQWPKFLGLV